MLLLAFLILLFFSSANAQLPASHSPGPGGFLQLNHTAVLQAIHNFMATDAKQLLKEESYNSYGFQKSHSSPRLMLSFPLYDRDVFAVGKKNSTYTSILRHRLARHEQRVKYLSSVTTETDTKALVTSVHPFSNEYVAVFRVGTPPQRISLFVDTTSSLVWWQCLPCNECYDQTEDPIYDSTASPSYAELPCTSNKCLRTSFSKCGTDPIVESCEYQIAYADGASSYGTMSVENMLFVFNDTTISIVFGCAIEQKGHFAEEASGSLGLSGDYSMTNQLNASVFSICVPGRISGVPSSLDFDFPSEVMTSTSATALIQPPPSPPSPNAFYVGLEEVWVGPELIEVPPFFWEYASGSKGTILDLGATAGVFPREAYSMLRYNFKLLMSEYKTGFTFYGSHSSFDTCYQIDSDLSKLTLPLMTFQFTDGGRLFLQNADQILIPVETDIYCLAFVPGDTNMTVIGNTQLQHTRLIFDLSNKRITFGYSECQ